MIDPAIFDGDPPVREDGKCVVCLKDRKPERSKRYAGITAELDPFCSNICARAWHENPIPDVSIWSKPGPPQRLEAA